MVTGIYNPPQAQQYQQQALAQQVMLHPYQSFTVSNNTATTTASTFFFSSGTTNNLVTTADEAYYPGRPLNQDITIHDEEKLAIRLPDGTVIDIEQNGFRVNDKDAKVIYRANRIREFNKYLNASDLLEDFIRFCGIERVKQGEVLELPIKLFIGWLVLEAARADKEPEPEVKLIPDLRRIIAPRCMTCGQFIRHELKRNRIEFCSERCFSVKFGAYDHGNRKRTHPASITTRAAALIGPPSPGPLQPDTGRSGVDQVDHRQGGDRQRTGVVSLPV